MAASGPTLASLVQSKVNSKMLAISGHAPLSQSDPSYFIEMCTAIGNGIGINSTSLSFTTDDTGFTAVPTITGSGTGTGIIVDQAHFTEDLYTNIRQKVIDTFGSTNHQAFPPGGTNSGRFLKALCEGISESVTEHFATVWSLTSSHPTIYAGSATVNNGNISGLSSGSVQSTIISLSPSLQGPFWPVIAEEVAKSYVDAIHNHSTATITITGICIPSPPPTLQLCNLPGSGSGSGSAT